MVRNNGSLILLGWALVWAVTLVLLLQTFKTMPYIGGIFQADIGRGMVATEVRQGDPLQASGITVGQTIVAIESASGTRLNLSGREAILGRHQTQTFAIYNDTLVDKARIYDILEEGPFTLIGPDGARFSVVPDQGPSLLKMDYATILKMLLALVVIMVAVGIWVFATPSFAVGMLAISGLGLATNMICGAFLELMEVTISAQLFHFVISTASWGGATFAYALLAVIWHFPKPITQFPWMAVLLVLGLILQINIAFQIVELPVNSFEIAHLIPAPVAVIASTLQWLNTRGKPLERASVMWFSMSIYGLVTIVLALYSVPVILDIPPILGPSLANVFLALIFFGIALGTLRYRLFDVHKIWLRVILWVLAGLLFVCLDVALAYALDLEQVQAVPFALLVAGWLYFPMRNKVSEWILSDREIRVGDHIPAMLERFSSVYNPEEIDGRFVNFLKATFKATEVASIDAIHIDEARIENQGLFLRVPMITEGRSAKLVGRANGRQLFSSSEKIVADTFLKLVRSIHASNVREVTRLESERRRITRDLHDDVGGKLLSLIYQSPDEATATRAQDALQALKETVYVLEDSQQVEFETAWANLLADVRALFPEFSGVETAPSISRVLSAREYINLKRIFQELLSNARKYARPGSLEISRHTEENEDIVIRFANITKGHVDKTLSGMRGLVNIRERASEMGVSISVEPSREDGAVFLVELRVPGQTVGG